MKKAIVTIILLAIIMPSCNNKAFKEKIIINNPEQEINNSNNKKIADLPIQIDSITTQILIHPIISINKDSKNYLNRSSYKSSNIINDRVNHYNDIITGNIVNLKFESLNSNKLISLSSKNLQINSITFLRGVYKKTTKEILLYSITDKDTNNDKQTDYKDEATMYISYIDGSNFKRLSLTAKDILHHYKFTLDKQRLYFNTLADNNQDGVLNTQDHLHYGYVDLTSDTLTIKPYFPL